MNRRIIAALAVVGLVQLCSFAYAVTAWAMGSAQLDPTSIAPLIQQGGTAALIAFMFYWGITNNKRATEERLAAVVIQKEKDALSKEMLDAMHKNTNVIEGSEKLLERMIGQLENVARAQLELLQAQIASRDLMTRVMDEFRRDRQSDRDEFRTTDKGSRP